MLPPRWAVRQLSRRSKQPGQRFCKMSPVADSRAARGSRWTDGCVTCVLNRSRVPTCRICDALVKVGTLARRPVCRMRSTESRRFAEMLVSLIHALESAVRAAPGAPALATRDTVWAYRELASAVDAAQRALCARSARRGSRVALLLSNSPQYVAIYYGAMAAGRVAVPLDTHEKQRTLKQQIRHCGASLLCGDPAHPEWAAVSADAAEYGVDIMQIPRHIGPDSAASFIELLRVSARAEPPLQIAADEPAAIFFTSGSTGRPK